MIAYWMLYAVAAGVPILLATLLVSAVLRRHGKPERGVWLAGLALALALPVLAFVRPLTPAGSPPPDAGMIGVPELVALPMERSALPLDEILIGLWALASTFLILRWAIAAARLTMRGRSWRSTVVDGIPVARTSDLGPAVTGVVRPRILVPSWLDSLPSAERSLVLLHEREHIRAGDPLLMMVARVARILMPWNPALWVLSTHLVRAIELDCDRRVLRRNPDVGMYGSTLINVSRRDSSRLVAVAAFAESEAPLRSRILAMTTPPRAISIFSLLTAGVLGVVLLIGAFEIPVPAVRVSIEVEPAEAGPPPEPTTVALPAEAETGEEPRAEPERPSAQETVEELRRSDRGEAATQPRGPTPQPDDELSAAPTFTPFTVPPTLLNRDEVVQAMAREYPTLLRDAGIGGTVRVYFFIDETGVVRNTRIDASSGHQALDVAALAVADVFRFSPALNRESPVPVWVNLPITFQLR